MKEDFKTPNEAVCVLQVGSKVMGTDTEVRSERKHHGIVFLLKVFVQKNEGHPSRQGMTVVLRKNLRG